VNAVLKLTNDITLLQQKLTDAGIPLDSPSNTSSGKAPVPKVVAAAAAGPAASFAPSAPKANAPASSSSVSGKKNE
jgi:hypothetical protein